MKNVRKLAAVLATAVLGIGVVGLTAPVAHADSNWPCPGCKTSNR